MDNQQLTRISALDRKKLKVLATLENTTCPELLHRLLQRELKRKKLLWDKSQAFKAL